MSQMTTVDLQAIIDTCRKNGIAHLKMGDLELTFGGYEEPEPEAPKPVNRDVKPGADGLTAAEQEELYGRPIDASN